MWLMSSTLTLGLLERWAMVGSALVVETHRLSKQLCGAGAHPGGLRWLPVLNGR
jgi:hypothetical protein